LKREIQVNKKITNEGIRQEVRKANKSSKVNKNGPKITGCNNE
jgi:hypothetical protein